MLKTEEILEKKILKILEHIQISVDEKKLKKTFRELGAHRIMDLFSQQKEACREDVILKSDLARAIGHMQGCGHPDQYLEDKYPEFKEKSLS